MAFLPPTATVSQFLQAPSAPGRKPLNRPRDAVDDFLSSDLEMSFASTMSLHSSSSSPCGEAMDISPAPSNKIGKPLFDDDVVAKMAGRPRSFTSNGRLFGTDVSNGGVNPPNNNDNAKNSTNNSISNRKLARPGLPTEWFSPSPTGNRLRSHTFAEGITPPTPSDCGMDVDSEFGFDQPAVPLSAAPTITAFQDLSSPAPATAHPLVSHFRDLSSPMAQRDYDDDQQQQPGKGSDFGNFFYESSSPHSHRQRRSLDSPAGPFVARKRRSASPEPAEYGSVLAGLDADDHSSSPAPSSPMQRKLERITSNPLLNKFMRSAVDSSPEAAYHQDDLGSPLNLLQKRPRRPALSVLYDGQSAHSAYPMLKAASAHPELQQQPRRPSAALPPPRRAFSAMMPPTVFGQQQHRLEDIPASPADEANSSFGDGSFGDMSSPAQAYAKRAQMKTIRRCDGTEDFRPLTGASALVRRDEQQQHQAMMASPGSRMLMSPGLPGFGDNEAHGKILPCHRVKEDGLMRIVPQTLNDLLDGRYDARVARFFVIDCRFDYEYEGGHVPGAVNINTTAGVEEFLLAQAKAKPSPCTSGDTSKKTVLVFHCEFSAKRAPTFAKHLRSKDRAMNNHNYPKIHYPEVYILEGGYCEYYKQMAHRCQPSGYVRMDDPSHAQSRKEDLDQFRKAKFGRTKSYAYGDSLLASKALTSGAAPAKVGSGKEKRNTAPAGGAPSVFAAANVARTRRGGALATLAETAGGLDGGETTETEDETDFGDSPCPAPGKNAGVPFVVKKAGRAPLLRAETAGRFGY